jgi:thioredoxin
MPGVNPVTDESFEAEVLQAATPVVIDLWAPWCGPCVSLAPIVEKLSEQYDGKVKFVKVNVDENMAIAQAFRVQSIPLLAILKGNTVVGTVLGLRSQSELSDWIDGALKLIDAGLPNAETEA